MLKSLLAVPVLVIGGLVLLAILWIIGAYNSLVALRNRFKNAYAQIDVQLKRRYDLIPNLVETAKGYLKHERARSKRHRPPHSRRHRSTGAGAKSLDPAPMKQLPARRPTWPHLGRLFALAEAYPDLKANTTMITLMEELTSTENKVAFARQAYNDAVMSYNTRRETFPTNLIAGAFNFAPAELFVIEKPAEKEAPRVTF